MPKDYSGYLSVDELERELANDVHKRRIKEVASRCVGSVLDVGAGTGNLGVALNERARAEGKGAWGYLAHEVRQDYVERIMGKGLVAVRVKPELWAGGSTPIDIRPAFEGRHDTVVLGEILEHLPNPGEALDRAFETARRKVILTIPNTASIRDDWHLWEVKWKPVDHLLVVEFERKEESP